MQIKYIDGIRLQKAIYAGINHVINRKGYLNKINVFPVPDGDTGTNMAYTLSTIANEIKSTNQKPISKMAEAISDASLNGARGNSGSILAQFFVGFSEGSESYNKLNPKGTYKNPFLIDGDIITVKRNILGKTTQAIKQYGAPIINSYAIYRIFEKL